MARVNPLPPRMRLAPRPNKQAIMQLIYAVYVKIIKYSLIDLLNFGRLTVAKRLSRIGNGKYGKASGKAYYQCRQVRCRISCINLRNRITYVKPRVSRRPIMPKEVLPTEKVDHSRMVALRHKSLIVHSCPSWALMRRV